MDNLSFDRMPAAINSLIQRIDSNYVTGVGLVLVLAAALRLAVILVFADVDPETANLWEYGQIAKHYMEFGYLGRSTIAADGSEFAYPTAFMPPFMIWLWIGLFTALGTTPLALAVMLAINLILSLGVVILTGAIALKLFDKRLVALGSMLIVSLYPTFVFSVATYHTINLYLFPFFLAILIALNIQTPLPRHAVIFGILGGIGALIRTEYVFLFGAMFVFVFAPWRHWRLFVLATLTSAAIILPWTVRNYIVFDSIIPIANSTGFNLYKGFNPLANGSGDWVDNNASLVRGEAIAHRFHQVPFDVHYEKSHDDIFRELAFEYIRDDPFSAFVVLGAKKVVLFWIFDFHDPMAWQALYQIAFWPVFIASVGGLILVIRRSHAKESGFRFVFLLFVVQTIVMVLYAVHLRYRMNVEPFLFIFAAYFAVDLISRWATRVPAT